LDRKHEKITLNCNKIILLTISTNSQAHIATEWAYYFNKPIEEVEITKFLGLQIYNNKMDKTLEVIPL
jgi:hypothetical protein